LQLDYSLRARINEALDRLSQPRTCIGMILARKLRRAWALLRTYWRLPVRHREAARRAAYWIVVIRAALACCPFKRVLRYVERRAEAALRHTACAGGTPPVASRPTLWAIHAVGRRLMPARPCLTQALVGRLLLAREGVDVTVHIGVAKSDGDLRAHAWLERDGTIILGGVRSRDAYRPFPALNG
jgi:hypothetical protein